MNERLSLQQETDPNEEAREVIRDRLRKIFTQDPILGGLLTHKKALELQIRYPKKDYSLDDSQKDQDYVDYHEHEAYHLLIRSQKPSYQAFDFPDKDSVRKWAEDLKITDQMREISRLCKQYITLSGQFYRLARRFQQKQGDGMWSDYKDEVSLTLKEVSQSVEQLQRLELDAKKAQDIMEDVKQKMETLRKLYEELTE